MCFLNFVIFLNSASSAAALVIYLPDVCKHIDTEGKQRKARVRNISKSSKKTQYLMNILYNIALNNQNYKKKKISCSWKYFAGYVRGKCWTVNFKFWIKYIYFSLYYLHSHDICTHTYTCPVWFIFRCTADSSITILLMGNLLQVRKLPEYKKKHAKMQDQAVGGGRKVR